MSTNGLLRAPWHDYTERCIYMLTLNKAPLVPDFGSLAGDYWIPHGHKGCPCVVASPVGAAIKEGLRRFPQIQPKIRVLQYAIMPDHLHILLFVQEKTEEILGRYIAAFKVEINKAAGLKGVFARGFNDQILKTDRSLDTLYHYLRDNARRLAVRRAHPEFFRRVNALRIGDRHYQAYGNIQLLDCPFRQQVVVHRADTPDVRQRHRQEWLYTAANGGVLVSPFISPAEKEIRMDAEEADGRLILITNEPMGERYKPAGHDFGLCETGRLLIISVGRPGPLSRQTCLDMNVLASEIAAAAAAFQPR
jgi:hypothetical protein